MSRSRPSWSCTSAHQPRGLVGSATTVPSSPPWDDAEDTSGSLIPPPAPGSTAMSLSSLYPPCRTELAIEAHAHGRPDNAGMEGLRWFLLQIRWRRMRNAACSCFEPWAQEGGGAVRIAKTLTIVGHQPERHPSELTELPRRAAKRLDRLLRGE